jgi:hypothetical protein
MTNTKCRHAKVRGIIGGLIVREVSFKARPQVQDSITRIEELLRCLWYCTDTVQSGRTLPIFGMHVVVVDSSASLSSNYAHGQFTASKFGCLKSP